MIASSRKTLPLLAVLTCVLITTVGAALGMQIRASWRLGVPLKFRADHVWMLLRSDNHIELARPFELDKFEVPYHGELHVECRNRAFTDDPIWFCGDSQLQYFYEHEAVSSNSTIFFRPCCTAQTVLRRSASSDATKAKVVIIHIGFGDLAIDSSGAGLLKGYKEILDKLNDKKILVLLPEAVNEHKEAFLSANRIQAVNECLRGIRARIAALCSAYPNVRVLDITPRIVDSTGNVYPHLLQDSVHLNGEGHDIIWAAIKEKLHGWVNERPR
jgi:hypothetical protein